MPLDPLTLLSLVVSHPATWATLAMLTAFLFGGWVRRQLRVMGVVELEDRVRWSRAIAAMGTLLAATLLEAMVANAFGYGAAATWLASAFLKALSLLPALMLLSGVGWWSVHRRGTQTTVSPAVASELRWVQLGAALLAALSIVQAPMVPLLGVLILGGAVWWYATTPGAAEKVRNWQRDMSAGSQLRGGLDADATVELDGEKVSVIGKAGLLQTDVLTEEGMKTVPNRQLAQAAAARRVTS